MLLDLAQALGAREDKRELLISRGGVEWRVLHGFDSLRVSAPIQRLPSIAIGPHEPWKWPQLFLDSIHRSGDRKLDRAGRIVSEFPLKTVRRVLASRELRAQIRDALSEGYRVTWGGEVLGVSAKSEKPTVELIERMIERAQKIRASLPQLPPELAVAPKAKSDAVAFMIVLALGVACGYLMQFCMTVNRDGFTAAALVGLVLWALARPIIGRYQTVAPAGSMLLAVFFAIYAVFGMIFINAVGCRAPIEEHRGQVLDLRWSDYDHEALIDSWRGKREWIFVSHELYRQLHKGDMILVRTSMGRLGYEFVRGTFRL